MFLDAKHALEENDQRNDVAVHSAAERPELLLYVILVFTITMSGRLNISCDIDYYGDTFFKSAGTTYVLFQILS